MSRSGRQRTSTGGGRAAGGSRSGGGPAVPTPPAIEGPHKHTFIQAMMSRSVVPEDVAKNLYTEIVRAPSGEHFGAFLASVNSDLDFVHFEIRRVKYHHDEKTYIGIINKVEDEHAKLGSRLSVPQIQYFKTLVEAIALDSEGVGFVTTHVAENIKISYEGAGGAGGDEAGTSEAGAQQSQKKQLSPSEKEATLRELVRDGWLAHPPAEGESQGAGKFCLGVRTFLELRNFLLALELPESTKALYESCL